MKTFNIYLALYDQSWDSGNGVYWTWFDDKLELRNLDNFYYEIAAKFRPEAPNELKRNDVWGGIVLYDSEWIVMYRFYNGGNDRQNRPGRSVLLTGWIKKSDRPDLTIANSLLSTVFCKYAETVQPIPVPIPAKTCISSEKSSDNTDSVQSGTYLQYKEMMQRFAEYLKKMKEETASSQGKHLIVHLSPHDKKIVYKDTKNKISPRVTSSVKLSDTTQLPELRRVKTTQTPRPGTKVDSSVQSPNSNLRRFSPKCFRFLVGLSIMLLLVGVILCYRYPYCVNILNGLSSQVSIPSHNDCTEAQLDDKALIETEEGINSLIDIYCSIWDLSSTIEHERSDVRSEYLPIFKKRLDQFQSKRNEIQALFPDVDFETSGFSSLNSRDPNQTCQAVRKELVSVIKTVGSIEKNMQAKKRSKNRSRMQGEKQNKSDPNRSRRFNNNR